MKIKLMSFAVVAGFVAIFLSSCTKPTTEACTPNEDAPVGGYLGVHTILGFYNIDDSITVDNPTASDRKIIIKSERLGTILIGTYDATNCDRVNLDTMRITSQSIGSVRLDTIVATGYGLINGNKIQTVINIKSGTANLDGLVLKLSGESLTGTFTKQ